MVQYRRPSCSSWAKSVWSSIGRTIMGRAIWENPIEARLGKGFQLGMLVGWRETKHWSDVETTQQRSRFGRTHIIPWSCILAMHSKTMWNKQEYCGQLQSHVWIANFCGREQKSFHTLRIFVFLDGLMIWNVMQRNVWSDIVSKQTRRLNNSKKYLLQASMTTTSQRKKQNLLENCQLPALK